MAVVVVGPLGNFIKFCREGKLGLERRLRAEENLRVGGRCLKMKSLNFEEIQSLHKLVLVISDIIFRPDRATYRLN